jgi:hypothetical protein
VKLSETKFLSILCSFAFHRVRALVRTKSVGEGTTMRGSKTESTNEAGKGVKPLAVPVKIACRLIGVGNTSMWALIKAGRVKTVSIGRRRLVIYASLEALLSGHS